MRPITEYEIHIFGMNRSGQHAILGWLLGMFDNVLFKNNMGKGQFIINPVKMRSWPFFYYENYGNKMFRKKWEAFSPKHKMDAIILGSENSFIDVFAQNYDKIFTKRKQNVVKIAKKNGCDVDTFSRKQIFIPVVRSPYNHAASCLKWRGNKHYINQPDNFISLWKSYAKEYLGITKYLPEISVPINYDKWFVDKKYRKELFDKMKIDVEYSDRNLNKVLGFGKGSSFSRQAHDKKAQKMKVTERWKVFMDSEKPIHNHHYLSMLNDKELLELSEKIYGEMPFIIKEM